MLVISYLVFVLALTVLTVTGTEGAVSLVALTTCKAFPWKISVKCVPRFYFFLFLGTQRNSFLSSSPFFIHPPFPRTSHLHLLPRLRDHRRRRCLSHCQEPGEASLALSSVQVTGWLPDGAYANKKP